MNRATTSIAKVLFVCASAAIGFAILHESVRALETSFGLAVLKPFVGDAVHAAGTTTMLVIPNHSAAFHVLITPSCSALASVLAFACIGPVLPERGWGMRTFAVGSAALLVALGNILRISGSIAIGLVFGRKSLVLFHDWVGSLFTIAYTLLGFVLMLRFLLPKQSSSTDLVAEVMPCAP